MNNAHIDSYATDSSGSASEDVSAGVTVGGVVVSSKSSGERWQPHDWGFDLSNNICGPDSDGSYSSPICTSFIPEEVG